MADFEDWKQTCYPKNLLQAAPSWTTTMRDLFIRWAISCVWCNAWMHVESA